MRRTQLAAFLSLVVTFCGTAKADLVAHWQTGGFAGGTWTDSVGGIAAVQGGGNVTSNAEGVVFDGSGSYLAVAGAQSPVAGLNNFSMTARFKVVQGATGSGKDPNNPGHFWANASLVGRELPSATRGDYNLAINSENELVAGWGNPDGGIVHDGVALNDDQFHTATATFAVGGNPAISLYLDGVQVATSTNNGRTPEFETMNIGVNIATVAGDWAFLNGTISDIAIHNTTLTEGEVIDFQNSLVIPEPSSIALAVMAFGGLGGCSLRRRRRRR